MSGNALFLILIAVALFAALGYAVTQSGRGSGDVTSETTTLEAAEIAAYVAGVHAIYTRMLLTGQIDTSVAGAGFCTPAGVACVDSITLAGIDICTNGTDCIFGPDGGGFYVMDGIDVFYEEGQVSGVGTTANDAYILITRDSVTSLEEDLCRAINKGLGLGTTIEEEATGSAPYVDGIAALEGQLDFCWDSIPGAPVRYAYMHILRAE